MSNKEFEGRGCKYRTFLKDYKVSCNGTREEKVVINNDTLDYYEKEYSQWLHIKNLQDHHPAEWRQCEYFDQLNIALSASHSILNYPMFFGILK